MVGYIECVGKDKEVWFRRCEGILGILISSNWIYVCCRMSQCLILMELKRTLGSWNRLTNQNGVAEVSSGNASVSRYMYVGIDDDVDYFVL